ncbi:hypothetical protein JVU11DRAFT_2545 [Chiua virens]|nr:hypothetical protein JVU11DRAFT_2545 [Chiua virens]
MAIWHAISTSISSGFLLIISLWLSHSEQLPAIRELRNLCKKYMSNNAKDNNLISLSDYHDPSLLPVPGDLQPLTSCKHVAFHACFQTGGIVNSCHSTYLGNTLILFYPQDSRTPTPGCIKYIFEDHGSVWFAVHHHPLAPDSMIDPYCHYPYFPAWLYLASLSENIELVLSSWVLSHIAQWCFSELVVILALMMTYNR